MHGQALHLANTSLRLLIENLNKNDFFAVAKVWSRRHAYQHQLAYLCVVRFFFATFPKNVSDVPTLEFRGKKQPKKFALT